MYISNTAMTGETGLTGNKIKKWSVIETKITD